MDQSSHLATMRLGGHGAFAYLSVYRPDPVAVFTLDATPASGATALHGAYTTGSESNTRQGFYWRAYTSGGVFKGDGRVRNSGPRTSTSLPIRELGYGSAKLASGDLIKIYPYVQMDTKLVEASAAFNPDGEPFSDEGLHPAPVVNFGSHWAGWVDPITGYALVTGKGSTSFLVDSTSATPVTHFSSPHPATGVAYHTGSNSSANPVFELDPGQYCIEHVGTDPDNGRVGTTNVVYMAHDPDTNPPYHVFLPTPPTGDPVNGWSWVVELITAADIESIWDGALCILWVDEYIGGVDSEHKQSFRGNNDDRSHILGIGYARRDTSTGNAQDGDRITFEIQSPISRLAEIAAYSNVKQEVSVPAAWTDVKTLGVKRGAISLWHDYTFAQEAGFDFKVHSLYSDARYPAFYLQRSDIVSQIRELAEGRKARFVNKDRGATFELQPHPAYLSMTDRNSVTVNSTLTDDDVLGYSVTREHLDSLEIYELQGITAGTSGNASVYSRFPGLSPAGGKNYTVKGRYIPDSQTSQNADAAMMGAYEQQVFIDSTNSNVKHRVGEMTLDLPGAYGYFDFDLEYMKFNYSGDLRGIDYNGFRCWLKRFQTTVNDDGEWVYQAVFQQETGAPAGAAQTYVPTQTVSGITDAPTPLPFPAIIVNSGLGSSLKWGSGHIAWVGDDGYLYYTTTFNSAAPVWSRLNLAMSGTAQDFVGNPFSPRYLTGSGNVNLKVVTTTHIYDVLWNPDSPTSATVTDETPGGFTGGANSAVIETERGFSGVWGIARVFSGSLTEYWGTTDGATWSIHTTLIADGFSNTAGLFVSPRVSGKIITATSSLFGAAHGEISSNNGSSFAATTSPDISGSNNIGGLHFPFNNNASENVCYYGTFSGGVRRVYVVNGTTKTEITPEANVWIASPKAVDTCPVNRNYLVACVTNATVLHVWGATDGQTLNVSIDTSNTYRGVSYSGNDIHYFYLYGDSGAIAAGSISGTVEDRTGNLATFSPGGVLRIFGF